MNRPRKSTHVATILVILGFVASFTASFPPQAKAMTGSCREAMKLVNKDHIYTPNPLSGKNYYEILGVDIKANPETIRVAYRQASKIYFPDNKQTGNADAFRNLKAAYDVLGNDQKRNAYDIYSNFDGKVGNDAAGSAQNNNGAQATATNPTSPRDTFLKNFWVEVGKLDFAEKAMASVLLPQYFRNRAEKGPVRTFLDFLDEWFPQRSLWEHSHNSTKFAEFFMKHFIEDFTANSPSAQNQFELFKILTRYPWHSDLRDQAQGAIIERSYDLGEGLKLSLATKMFYNGSGLSVSEIINRASSKFNTAAEDTVWALMTFTILDRQGPSALRDGVLSDSLTILLMQGSSKSLQTLVHLKDTYTWSREFSERIDGLIYSVIHNHPETLTSLHVTDPASAKTAEDIFKVQKASADKLEELWKWARGKK